MIASYSFLFNYEFSTFGRRGKRPNLEATHSEAWLQFRPLHLWPSVVLNWCMNNSAPSVARVFIVSSRKEKSVWFKQGLPFLPKKSRPQCVGHSVWIRSSVEHSNFFNFTVRRHCACFKLCSHNNVHVLSWFAYCFNRSNETVVAQWSFSIKILVDVKWVNATNGQCLLI